MNLVNTLVQHIQTVVAGDTNRKARSKAIRSALMSAANIHPDYKGIGFDEQLMANAAADIIEPFLNDGILPTAQELSAAWAAQFPYLSEHRKRAIVNITPMVTDFIAILASEVASLSLLENPAAIPTQPYYAKMSGTSIA